MIENPVVVPEVARKAPEAVAKPTPETVMKDLTNLAKLVDGKDIDVQTSPETKAIEQQEKAIEDEANVEINAIRKLILNKKFDEADREA